MRLVAEAEARSAGYPWPTWPVVVTTEHGSADGRRPWWWGVRLMPIADDAPEIVRLVLAAWKRDAPHPIQMEPEDCTLRHDEGIVYLLGGRAR
jgi:hypothetical protein